MTTSNLGKVAIPWPDLGTAGGAALQTLVHDGVAEISNRLTSKWFTNIELLPATPFALTHKLGLPINELRTVLLKNNAPITFRELSKDFTLLQTDLDTITITNNTVSAQTVTALISANNEQRALGVSKYYLTTTDATPTEIFAQAIPQNGVYSMRIEVTAKGANAQATRTCFIMECIISNDTGVVAFDVINTFKVDRLVLPPLVFSATTDALTLDVVGLAATTIVWVANVTLVALGV